MKPQVSAEHVLQLQGGMMVQEIGLAKVWIAMHCSQKLGDMGTAVQNLNLTTVCIEMWLSRLGFLQQVILKMEQGINTKHNQHTAVYMVLYPQLSSQADVSYSSVQKLIYCGA